MKSHRTILTLLVSVQLLLAMVLVATATGWPDPLSIIGFAFLFSLTGVLSVWAALVDDSKLVRYPVVFGATAAGCVLFTVAHTQSFDVDRVTRMVAEISLMAAIQIVCVLGPLLLVRGRGIRLEQLRPGRETGARQRLQFSIRYLFGWTTVVAVGAALVRWAQHNISWAGVSEGYSDLVLSTAVGVCFASIALLGGWAALGSAPAPVRVIVLLVLAPPIGLMPPLVTGRITSGYTAFPLLTAITSALLAGSLAVFRVYGYRLTRRAVS